RPWPPQPPLVNHPPARYSPVVLKQLVLPTMLVCCGLETGLADVIQLKDKASVSGTVLAEKRDQVVVDIGYTVLVIPRKEIVKISKIVDATHPPARAP